MRAMIFGLALISICLASAVAAEVKPCEFANNCPKPKVSKPEIDPPAKAKAEKVRQRGIARENPRIDAAKRAAEEARQQSAAKVAACRDRFEAMSTNEANETDATFQPFLQSCPVLASSQVAVQLQLRIAARTKLKGELTKWGLTERQMCGLEERELLDRSLFDERRTEVQPMADSGDSVASLLLATSFRFAFYEFGNAKNWRGLAGSYFSRSSLAGNPRAMVEAATAQLLASPSPDLSEIDPLLKRAREMNCGMASNIISSRVAGFGGPPPDWAKEFTRYDLLKEALARGFGGGACNLAASDSNAVNRKTYYQQAIAEGDPCGELGLLLEGDPAKGSAPFGPCAVNYLTCIRGKLAELRGRRVPGAGVQLAHLQQNELLGRSSVHFATYVPLRDDMKRNLLEDSKNGHPWAMARLGTLNHTGIFGGTVSSDAGKTWCERAEQLGSVDGGACLGIFGGGGQAAIDRAFQRDKCAPYNVAFFALPFFFDLKDASDMRTFILKTSTLHRQRLRSWLPMIRYALTKSAGSGASCAGQARQWINILDFAFKAPF